MSIALVSDNPRQLAVIQAADPAQTLEALGTYHPKVIEQVAGVRPTVLDRRPLMGMHPNYPGVFIFNGLGTKGYMMAPTLARELVEHITANKPLNPEINIGRFTDKHL